MIRRDGTDLRALLLAAALLAGGGFWAGCSSEGPADAPPEEAPESAAAGTTATDAPAAPPTRTDQGRSVEERIEDASLAARVKTALMEDRQLRTFDFEPLATDGRVTLAGDVSSREQGRRAADLADEVDDVDDVLNRLTVGGQQVAWNESSSSSGGAQTASGQGEGAPGGASSGGAAVAGASSQQSASSSPESSASEESPSAGEAAGEESAEAYHVVQQGESLWAIASQNDITVARLKELNGLSSNNLMPGDRLRVE